MTREQAIDLLDNLIGMIDDNQENDYDTAFKMGIKALQEQADRNEFYNWDAPIRHKAEGEYISRQAVLNYIHRILNQGTGKKKSFEFIQKYVEKLPSVKPQEPNTVIATGDGAYYKIKALQAQADGEYIPKQTVLENIDQWYEDKADIEDLIVKITYIQGVAIPNKVGHWECNQYDGNPNIGNWHCSECRNIVSDMPTCMGKPLYEFCPHCGSPMEIER